MTSPHVVRENYDVAFSGTFLVCTENRFVTFLGTDVANEVNKKLLGSKEAVWEQLPPCPFLVRNAEALLYITSYTVSLVNMRFI